MSLHTRSLKYGKLTGGVLVVVAPSLIKRLKQHFHRFDFGVDAIFGMNGYVWVSPTPEGAAQQEAESAGMLNDVAASGQMGADAPPARPATWEEREKVSRVRNALVALDATAMAVSPTTVAAVYAASLHLPTKDMLLPHVLPEICAPAAASWPEATLGDGQGGEEMLLQ